MRQITVNKVGSVLLAAVSICIWVLLLWGHFNGGVPSHSFLAREDMPSISNWWGGLLLPLLTYFSIFRIKKRIGWTGETPIETHKQWQSILLLFLAGLIYGGSLAFAFEMGHNAITGVLFPGLFLLGLIVPIHRAEFFLGFVIGMTYTFGAVLPTVIAATFVMISFVAHQYIYPFVLKLLRK